MRNKKNETITLKKGGKEVQLDYADLRKAVLVLRASQHLAILRRAGVVATERQGKFIYYSLDQDRLNQISKLVEELAG